MLRQMVLAVVVVGVVLRAEARGDLIVTLEPREANMNPVTGSVPAGSQIVVDILLSADGEDNPLADLQLLQFDFGATSPTIELGLFTWVADVRAYEFNLPVLPVPGLFSVCQSCPDLICVSCPALLSLTAEPLLIATIEVTVNGSGTLNAVGSTDVGQTTQAQFNAASDPPVIFRLDAGNLRGGTIELTASDAPSSDGSDGSSGGLDQFRDSDDDGIVDGVDPDDDNDGVDDTSDDFPLDPTETADTDGDGVGDNADDFPVDPTETTDTDNDGLGNNADPDDDNDGVTDTDDAFPLDPNETMDRGGDGTGENADQISNTGPRGQGRLCGVAMAGTSIFILCGLPALSLSRRRWKAHRPSSEAFSKIT